MHRIVAVALIGVFAVAGCQETSPTAPNAVVSNVTGTWEGTSVDTVENSRITWTLTQTGSMVEGNGAYIGLRTDFRASGPIEGTTTGSTFTFSASLTFAPPFQFCQAAIQGSAELSGTTLAGTYSGTNCQGGPFVSGQFSLTKR